MQPAVIKKDLLPVIPVIPKPFTRVPILCNVLVLLKYARIFSSHFTFDSDARRAGDH
jgi:hypothetical protein